MNLEKIGLRLIAAGNARQTNIARYGDVGHLVGMLGQEERDISELFDTQILDKNTLAELEERVATLQRETVTPLLKAIKEARASKATASRS